MAIKIGSGMLSILGRVAYDLGIEKLGREFFGGVSKEAGEELGKKVGQAMKDIYGELLADIRKLEYEDRQTFLRRLAKAARENRDDLVERLLVKIPKEDRLEVFKWMAWLDDDQFETVLNLLEQHWTQGLKRCINWAKKKMSPTVKEIRKLISELNNLLGELADSLDPAIEGMRAKRDAVDGVRRKVKRWADKRTIRLQERHCFSPLRVLGPFKIFATDDKKK